MWTTHNMRSSAGQAITFSDALISGTWTEHLKRIAGQAVQCDAAMRPVRHGLEMSRNRVGHVFPPVPQGTSWACFILFQRVVPVATPGGILQLQDIGFHNKETFPPPTSPTSPEMTGIAVCCAQLRFLTAAKSPIGEGRVA